MDLSPRPYRCEGRRSSMDSDYGLSCSTSTIDPNDTMYSDCSSCLSLDSSFEDDVFSQSLVMASRFVDEFDDMVSDTQAAEVLSFKNTSALCEDMRLVDENQDMCDIKFLTGKDQVPVYGVRAILCARSRVICSLILAKEQSLKKEKSSLKKRRRGIFRLLRRKRGEKDAKFSNNEDNSTSDRNVISIEIPEFPADVIRRLVLFLHSGTISIDLSNVIGVMSAADQFGLEDLRSASYQFARRFITLDTVLTLLGSTELYKHYKLTQKLLDEVLSFIDTSTDELFRHAEFRNLSQCSTLSILSRKELRTSEERKWDAALDWSRHNAKGEGTVLQKFLKSFTPNIDLLQIPLPKLMGEVTPLCSGQVTDFKTGTVSPLDVSTLTQIAFNPDTFYRKCSVSSAGSKFSLASHSTDSGYTSSFRESCLL